MVPALRGLGDGELAVGMKGPVAAGRRDHDRAVVADAEDLDAHVDLADVDQPPRPQLELPEALAVGAQRHLVVDAGRHVAEMRRRDVLLHHRLEVEHVERLPGVGDQLVEIARRPVHRIGQPQLLPPGRCARQQRACRQELQQAAAAGDAK